MRKNILKIGIMSILIIVLVLTIKLANSFNKEKTITTNNVVYYASSSKKEKIGDFDATLYGATAWANQNINLRSEKTKNSRLITTIPTGTKLKILSSDDPNTKYIKVKYNNKEGYVYSDFLYINLPDVMPDIIYKISNADSAVYTSAGKPIPGVTGKNLYGFTKKYNSKIGKSTYYAPLLYPVSKQLQNAYRIAKSEGYNFKIYDTYRPYDVSVKINEKFKNLYNSNNKVYNMVNYDKNGVYWGTTWFLANGISRHNRADAIDMTLVKENGTHLHMQTRMHTLDTRSVTKYNTSDANKLRSIMTAAGFETLESEWWHFQEDNYRYSPYNTFHIR